MSHAQQPTAEPVGDPNVAPAVDGKTAAVEPDLEVLGLARISSRKARDVVDAAVGHPNAVLLVDAEVKWCPEGLARLLLVALANDPALGQVALGEVYELALLDAQDPHVGAGRDDDTLHQTKLAVEGDALGRRQRLAVLVEYGDGLAAVAGEPCIVLGIDGRTECATFHPAAGEAGGHRGKRPTVRRELGRMTFP